MVNLLQNLLEKADNTQEYSRFQLRHGNYKGNPVEMLEIKNMVSNMNSFDRITRQLDTLRKEAVNLKAIEITY